jgi:outer membrane receptor protein involved in Fe transport
MPVQLLVLSSRSVALAACLLAALPWSALAFRGRVVDPEGRPVARAEVYVLGRPGEAITDAEGRFDWQPDPPPPFEILVVAPGGTYMNPVLVEALDPETELVIVTAPVLNEIVTVSGSAPGIESTPAAGTTTLSSREIGVRLPTNLVQALENVAGVNQVSEGQAGVPAVRGLARGRTLILIDGARVTSERRVGPGAGYLDPAVVESIDVSRGPGSVAYGSDAFGGVIAVRTVRVARGSPWAVRFDGSAGTGVPEWRGAGLVSKGFAQGSVLLAVHARDADDWESPEGPVFNSGYADRGVLAKFDHQVGRGVLSAGWQSDFGRDIGRPRNNSRSVRFYYPTEDSHRFTAGYDLPPTWGFQRIGVSGFGGSYAQVTDQDRYATATTPRSIERADVSANDWGVRGFAERLAGPARLEFGVDLNGRFDLHALDVRETYTLSGALATATEYVSVERAHRVDYGVYASLDTTLTSWLTLGGGARADVVTTENSGGYFGDRSTSNGAGSGYLALTAGSFGGVSATGQVARGFRDPTLSDRYYRGPTGRGFITGNPDLEPETSLQYDIALRYTAPRFRVAGFYYAYRIDDLIERYQTEPDFFYFRNRGSARLEGIEVEAQAELGWGTSLEFAYQFATGRALDDDASLDDVTPPTASAQLRKAFGSSAFVQARTAFFADDDEPGPTERAVPGYTMVDLSGGYLLAAPLELRVLVRNLLDASYYASPDPRGVLAPGRSASLALTARF